MKRVLLDENLPKQLKNYFSVDFEVTSVPDVGWQSKKNGELLSAMVEAGYDILLTADRNLRFQQNLSRYPVRVLVIVAHDIRLQSLTGYIRDIESALMLDERKEGIDEIDLRQK